MQRAKEVHLHHAAKDVRQSVCECASMHYARVVDENVDASERSPHGVHRGLNLPRVGDVAGNGDRFDASTLELLLGLVQGARRQIEHGDLGARASETPRERASDGAGAPGDDDRASVEVTPCQEDLARGRRARMLHDW